MNKKNKIIVGVLALVVIMVSVGFYVYSLRYEDTDDAQIDTDITAVTSRVSGYIEQVNFEDNVFVNAGDTLIVLDDRELALNEARSKVSLENAEATLETTKENARSVEQSGASASVRVEELRIRVKNATKDFDRYSKMYSNGSVTQQEFDKIRTEKETLEKQLEAAILSEKEIHARIEAAKQQIAVSATVVKQRKIELDYAQLNHSYAYITAPFDGKVSRKNAVKGQLIQVGQALCSIIATNDLWVTANFKETQIKEMKPGMSVKIEVDAFPDEIIEGKLTSFSSATGAKFSLIPPDNATGNFVKVVQRVPVRIDLDKSSPIYGSITPGMNVLVKVILY
nr:HlyD family secretion protein [uncultured Carboxylicivirga sp.]